MGRRLFGTIRKLPSGRYQARYVDASGRRHEAPSTFATKADACRWLADVEAAIVRGTWVDPDAGRVLLAEYTQGWIDSRPGLRPRTRELYQSLLDLHLEPALGDVALDRLTPALVRRWYSSTIAAGDVGRVTLAKCYRLLRAVSNTAVADGLLARNPCVIKGAGTERSPERPVATLGQVWELAEAVEARFRALVLTAAFAGLRFGELAALTRERVDLDAGTIAVTETLVEVPGALLLGPPKSDAGRRAVAIPASLVPELERHLATYVGPEGDAIVFTGAKGAPLRRSNWSVKWRAACRAVGVDGLHFHDLRHTCNTLTAAAGASTRELMHRMGHSSAAAALRYRHATKERDAVIAKALDDVIVRSLTNVISSSELDS
jgi:integrase